MNPVKELLEAIEDSRLKDGYTKAHITTNSKIILTDLDDISYVTRYFFRVETIDGSILVNINNLEAVELFE